MVILLFVLVFALLGAPVFAVMAGTALMAWLLHPNPELHHVRFLAPDVLDERFAGSPILVTVPLFTFIGYAMAESQAPARIVRASNAFFGWMPGGLAIVCICASAFFTTLTGGSAVTIVAIGALLYPALRQRGYPDQYALGLVMTGGSLGLLLPPSLPILIYSLVAGIDFTKAFKAGLIPGALVIALLTVHAAYVGVKYRIPRTKPNVREMGEALWLVKWELAIPILILGGLATGLTEIDESAALAALYVVIIEVCVYKDLSWRDLPRVARHSMALAGALLLIMAMAMALTNYIISEQIPTRVFAAVTGLGVSEPWQFLLVLNVFMLIMGMLMEGFSAILVAVPLLIPFAAEFGLSPFHLAMMFLLNLEIAFLCPPLGQNLFVTSFRFNRPMVSLYRVALPFLGILVVGLVLVMAVPALSTALVQSDIAAARARAQAYNEPPREAWLLECVQEDRNHPLPCSPEDKRRYAARPAPEPKTESQLVPAPQPSDSAAPDDAADDDQELLDQMLGAPSADAGSAPTQPAPPGSAPPAGGGDPDLDDGLLNEMLQ